ncbi:hypothetical protein DL96DRAFT_1594359 [Flagelloscypha sp. PMI_526]|nr:hypothetical protein DL96DRAFT_1594359 [Flagelloscypha sp. PMI_526]
MSLPPINPDKTLAGITVDPLTLNRVIPESRRADGSVRKELKIRPGFTPQEDVKRFRGTRQAQMDASALPKGHIIGWVAPTPAVPASSKPTSKSAKKNAKRKEKREDQKKQIIAENWEDDDEEDVKPVEKGETPPAPTKTPSTPTPPKAPEPATPPPEPAQAAKSNTTQAKPARAPRPVGPGAILAKELAKLELNKR